MSVALLNEWKQVEISDELEAFFHVIVYCAVRYLWSNLSNSKVAVFINEYFDIFRVYDGRLCCGWRKEKSLLYNSLKAEVDTSITFRSPMDGVLQVLLSWFHGKFTVQRHELILKNLRESRPPTPASSARPAVQFRPMHRLHGRRRLDPEAPPLSLPDETPRALRTTPTEQQREAARLVETHDAILEVLDGAMTIPWPANDKVGDRLCQESP